MALAVSGLCLRVPRGSSASLSKWLQSREVGAKSSEPLWGQGGQPGVRGWGEGAQEPGTWVPAVLTPRSHSTGTDILAHVLQIRKRSPGEVLELTGSSPCLYCPELGPEARGSLHNRIMGNGWRALNTPSPWGDGDPGDRIFKVPRRVWCAATGKNGQRGLRQHFANHPYGSHVTV